MKLAAQPLLVLILCLAFAAGCGRSKHGSAPGNADAQPGGIYDAMALTGSWQNACTNRKGGGSHQARYTLGGATMVHTYTIFTTPDCRSGDEETVYTSKYADAASVTPADLAGYTTLKEAVQSLTCRLVTAQMVTKFDAAPYYGYTDWQVGQERDISGKKFDAKATAEFTVNQPVYFTLTKAGDVLLFATYKDHVALQSTDEQEKYSRAN